MKKNLLAVAVLCALSSGAALAQQAEGPWMVRARAVHLDSANKDSTPLGLSVNNKTIPEVDVTYFFNKNIAAELILTVPQKHTLSAGGAAIGTLKHLPPTLLAQYHFDAPGFKPYVGAGLNYTRFSSVNLPQGTALGSLTIDKNSVGLALQAGVDYAIDGKWSLNLDIKKVQIRTDLKSGAAGNLGKIKIDPLLIGVGVGYKF